MKKTLKLMMFAVLAFAMAACGGNQKEITHDDLKKAEATLFNDDMTVNESVAPQVAEKYCQFVKQHPNDTSAAQWLYHAMEINVLLANSDKSVELCDQLVKQYPQSTWAPMSLFLLGSYVYDDQLSDTAKAHQAFQKLIDNYPESPLVEDARMSIQYLGMSPEEIMSLIMMSQFEEEEDF